MNKRSIGLSRSVILKRASKVPPDLIKDDDDIKDEREIEERSFSLDQVSQMNEHRGLQSAFSTDKLHKKHYNGRKNKRDLAPKKKVSPARLEKQNGSGDNLKKNPTSKASLSSPRAKGRGVDSNM